MRLILWKMLGAHGEAAKDTKGSLLAETLTCIHH